MSKSLSAQKPAQHPPTPWEQAFHAVRRRVLRKFLRAFGACKVALSDKAITMLRAFDEVLTPCADIYVYIATQREVVVLRCAEGVQSRTRTLTSN